MRLLLVSAASLALAACSTLTTGTTQSITVTSDPSGATCRVTRDEQLIGIVNPTPGSLTISKSSKDLVIACTKDGFQSGTNTHRAEFQAATLGNLLIGGPIGIVVDAASGAVGTYPPSVAVVLPAAASASTTSTVAMGQATMEPIYSPSELAQKKRAASKAQSAQPPTKEEAQQ